MTERRQLGDSTLKLVTDECMLTVLSELSRGPVRARDIEMLASGIPHWTAQRRLQSLARGGFVSTVPGALAQNEYGRLGSPQTLYTLTDLGRDCLLRVPAAAMHCEHTWCSPPQGLATPGLWVLQVVADPRTRAIARALADGPLHFSDLRVRLPHLGRSTLRRRLRNLCDRDVLVREEHHGKVRYALSDGARHLVIVPLRAAQCEWQRTAPPDRRLSGDLSGVVHMLAPLGRAPSNASGTCQWRIDANGRLEADIYLAVASGKIAALNVAPMTAPQAVGHATAQVWCEALLLRDPSMIATTGDRTLLEAAFDGLSSALLA
jgi:DNA-binding HxlR family transcriptional regulator